MWKKVFNLLRGAQLASVLLLAVSVVLPLGGTQTSEQVRLSLGDLLELLQGEVTSTRVAALIEEYGINFVLDTSSEEQLRKAGAEQVLIIAHKKPGILVIHTKPPMARVFLDHEAKGTTTESGTLQLKGVQPGSHTLRVEAAEHRVSLATFWMNPGQTHVADIALESLSRPRPPVPAAPPPDLSGTIRYELEVAAEKDWTDTGIDVREGDTLRIRAEGTINYTSEKTCGPDGGEREFKDLFRPLPVNDVGRGALVGLIGESGGRAKAFFVGANADIPVPQNGRLFLGINDNKYDNNRGKFKVKVEIIPARR